ncbi:hypothetical protein DTO027B5_8972 [Paecilomyces variotii]|nr:hypothetical protein DTO169C6_8821 [Paecilomyces variotii]KAJ9230555.1 hypothetical protein DTO169E5_8394 [Paecilomyces variotii]KAJ9251454.1 hypothetical protein DTO207G8_5347 [Paecilomyces variotii]KAJ9327241.1 hypothetical protein DTO027B3_2005 [Paecilomyces variotii]KAJ9327390.1 hypothetical protein DTO027B5_8972 [Paecilomyces variotii]
MAPVGGALWRQLCAHQVYGANTNVGKTVVSTVLCNGALRHPSGRKVGFLKPVSTGPLDEADYRHIERFSPGTLQKGLYQFDEPVSPHIAAQSKTIPKDDEILTGVHTTLTKWADDGIKFALVETAGGVHSPGPNGNSQADLYRPLRLPVVLVGDSRLGGISSSISAFESLLIRGYDVHTVLLFEDDYYKNHEYLRTYFEKRGIPLLSLPQPPEKPPVEDADALARDQEALAAYYESVSKKSDIQGLLDDLSTKNTQRVDRLSSMAERAHNFIWYPFTQHQGMTAKDISVIDSAYDDYFQTYKPDSAQASNAGAGVLKPTFDGSASWWTQGLGHGNPELSLTAAYAAGRYGHVMFAGTVHEPALSLAESLIKAHENPRLGKVFYSDNGSTGMEVAVKMGLRASCARYGWDGSEKQISILGLKGSYHGDTIGVMDCSEPSTYNKKVEWYRGRGYWFDFPQIKMSQGMWHVEVPEELKEALGPNLEFPSLDSIFNLEERVNSDAAKRYRSYIQSTIEDLVTKEGKKFGALIMEPIILGAGGMLFADPLFQHTLTQVTRSNPQLFSSKAPSPSTTSWSGLPVIFDEVFTGLYRLGRRTAASFLGLHPDITVNAKLLTGGLLPLCTTMASNEIFDAFSSPEKSDALLHGHSYTAHAIGCTVAQKSLQTMMDMEQTGQWNPYRADWTSASPAAHTKPEDAIWSSWSHGLVRDLSFANYVEGLFAIGTVLSITLRDETGKGGYTSTAAQGLQKRLAVTGKPYGVHSRVLGNVIYLMASVTSKPESLREIEGLLREALL